MERPFEVLERVEGNDYRIQLANRKKILHTNLLKLYTSAATEENEVSFEPEGQPAAAAILEPEENFFLSRTGARNLKSTTKENRQRCEGKP